MVYTSEIGDGDIFEAVHNLIYILFAKIQKKNGIETFWIIANTFYE
jgi:hypothetical protein